MLNFSHIPLSCIYAYIDTFNHSVYVGFSSSNALYQIADVETALRKGIHDNKKLQESFNAGYLEFNVIKSYEIPPHDLVLRSEYNVVVNDFIKKNYRDMRGQYIPCHFTLKTSIIDDHTRSTKNGMLVCVFARSKGYRDVVLGLFETVPEANEWLDVNYPNKTDPVVPKFCENSLTKDFHKEHGYEIKIIK